MIDTTLTPAQEGRLTRLERENPDAKVIAWSEQHGGPVIRDEKGTAVVTRLARLARVPWDDSPGAA